MQSFFAKKRPLFFVFLLPHLAFAGNLFTSPRDTVRLVAQSPAPNAGTITLGLQFELAPGWHIYWSYPGDAGFAPAIMGGHFSPLRFPSPAWLVQGGIGDYVLAGEVLLPFTASDVSRTVTTTAQWLVCADICVPEHATFTLSFPTAPATFPNPAIVPSPFPATVTPDGTLTLSGPTATNVTAAHFFPAGPGMIVNAAPQPLGFTDGGLTLALQRPPASEPLTGVLELTDPSGAIQALSLTPQPGATPLHPPYLVLAFLGGLILNLMPCVFPVLALKAVAITRLGASIRREALGYTAGVLAAMLLLGGLLLLLRALGTQAGWGFQFQHPAFIALMAWLIFALTLNLAGLFEWSLPARIGRIHAQHSIATGFLAVLLATPCTAPFMGAAIAAALAAPVLTALCIFIALGSGLAMPFLLLAAIPALAGLLPRPGAWMIWLQRLLSIPMFATCLWLGWVLYRQTGTSGLLLLLTGAVLLLVTLTRTRLRPLALASVLLVPLLHPATSAPALTLPGATPYSPARLATLRAARTPIFIDLTAAWCVTCLVNEATTLKNPSVRTMFAAQNVALLVGDWTQKNPAITALLAANHRDGVPLYLYYPPGKNPIALPQILTPERVRTAITGK